jgi:uncharacterized membrane protein YcgQ (UPF0703/DUF1980 family)
MIEKILVKIIAIIIAAWMILKIEIGHILFNLERKKVKIETKEIKTFPASVTTGTLSHGSISVLGSAAYAAGMAQTSYAISAAQAQQLEAARQDQYYAQQQAQRNEQRAYEASLQRQAEIARREW